MRYAFIVLSMLFCTATSTLAQVSVGVGISVPGVSIGVNVPVYPELVAVPGYPVYYAPRMRSNYFFYDGMYWVYVDDNWYASSWYNGPWALVGPEIVPVYLLRVPVRYYRAPPSYFGGWRSDAAPRWGQHWGNQWEQRRSGWDRWDRRSAPAPAPLPVYQRQYSGDRYPRAVEQQQSLQGQRYRYQPRDAVVRQYYQEHVQRAPAPAQTRQQEAPRDRRQQDVQQQRAPQETSRRQQDVQQQRAPQETTRRQQERSSPPAPQQQAPAQAAPAQQKGPAVQEQRQQRQQAPAQAPTPQQKGPAAQEQKQQRQQAPRSGREDGKGRGHEKDGEERK